MGDGLVGWSSLLSRAKGRLGVKEVGLCDWGEGMDKASGGGCRVMLAGERKIVQAWVTYGAWKGFMQARKKLVQSASCEGTGASSLGQ